MGALLGSRNGWAVNVAATTPEPKRDRPREYQQPGGSSEFVGSGSGCGAHGGLALIVLIVYSMVFGHM
jgi:hypothetical protein